MESSDEIRGWQLTCLFHVLAGLGLGEGGDLVEFGVDAGMLEAVKVDTLAVHHTVRQLLGQALF